MLIHWFSKFPFSKCASFGCASFCMTYAESVCKDLRGVSLSWMSVVFWFDLVTCWIFVLGRHLVSRQTSWHTSFSLQPERWQIILIMIGVLLKVFALPNPGDTTRAERITEGQRVTFRKTKLRVFGHANIYRPCRTLLCKGEQVSRPKSRPRIDWFKNQTLLKTHNTLKTLRVETSFHPGQTSAMLYHPNRQSLFYIYKHVSRMT